MERVCACGCREGPVAAVGSFAVDPGGHLVAVDCKPLDFEAQIRVPGGEPLDRQGETFASDGFESVRVVRVDRVDVPTDDVGNIGVHA